MFGTRRTFCQSTGPLTDSLGRGSPWAYILTVRLANHPLVQTSRANRFLPRRPWQAQVSDPGGADTDRNPNRSVHQSQNRLTPRVVRAQLSDNHDNGDGYSRSDRVLRSADNGHDGCA